MSTQKEESSKPDTTEQQPKAPQTGELDEKQLNTVTGGALLYSDVSPANVGRTSPSNGAPGG
jgi:bacteriocin-like protein